MANKIVLVAEDRPELRKLVRMILGANGMEIHEADTGESSIKMARALLPGCVIMDVMMPGKIDGYQACAALRDDPQTQDIPVIMLTARGQAADRAEGMKAGAKAYITKPFSPVHLLQTVQTFFKQDGV